MDTSPRARVLGMVLLGWAVLSALGAAPASNLATAQQAFSRAKALLQAQRFAEAQQEAQRALALYEKEPGLDPQYVAMALDLNAAVCAYQQRPDLAEPLLTRALDIRVKQLGEAHPYVLTSLQSLVTLHLSTGAADKALPYLRRALAAQERLTGPESAEVLPWLDQLAAVLTQVGPAADALAARTRELALVEKLNGADSFEVAQVANVVGLLHKDAGDMTAACTWLRRALAVAEQARGPEDVNVGAVLNNLADTLRELGQYGEAEGLLRRALAIHVKQPGPGSPEALTDTANLGLVLYKQGKDAEAEALLRSAVAEREKTDPEDPDLSYALNSLAELLRTHARYAEARPLAERVVALRRRHPGPTHPLYATALQNLALLELELGDDARTRTLFDEALNIYVAALGPEHNLVANLLRNYASYFMHRNNPGAAVQVLERTLQIDVKTLGADHPRTGYTFNQLGMAHAALGEQDKAEAAFQKALAIFTAREGAGHPDVAMVQANLAETQRARGELLPAQRTLRAALKTLEKAYGPNHPMVATCHNNLGTLALGLGDLRSAEKEMLRALAVRQKVLGPHHPLVMQSMSNLIDLWVLAGRVPKAVPMAAALVEGWEKQLPLALATGSEEGQLKYMETLVADLSRVVALNVQRAPRDAAATRTALRAVLAWKGRVLDEVAQSRRALRERAGPDVVPLLDREAALRAQVAALSAGGDTGAAKAAEREDAEVQLLSVQDELARKSVEYRTQHPVITLAAVQAALPPRSALLELTQFQPTQVQGKPAKLAWDAPHYAAYVLLPSGKVEVVDLGPAQELDTAVRGFHAAVSAPGNAGVTETSRALYDRTLGRLESSLQDVDQVLAAPSMEFNNVPLGALLQPGGHPVLERLDVVYLGSGRDLLRLKEDHPLGRGTAVVANPDFGPETGPAVASRGASPYAEVRFSPLPGTHGEAQALRQLLPGTTAVEGADATEERLKNVQAPRVLHVATHGFYLQADGQPAAGTRGLKLTKPPADAPKQSAETLSPLLRSGLALAGANRGVSGKDDGVLTALEVGGMNLWGTGLVVLSACETGLGASSMDGVMGLRRALVVAGSQSQVVSLWAVDDDATRALMTAFYGGLKQGLPRSQALRRAQLQLAADPRSAHPAFWAAFILSGDWRPLALEEP